MPNDTNSPDAVDPAVKQGSEPVAEPAAAEGTEPAAAEEAKAVDPVADKKARRKRVMKKILKWTGITLAVIFVLLVLALIFRDPLIRFTTGTVGSYLTGVKVRLGVADTSLFKGYVRIGEFTVDNPEGYNPEKKAISLGEVYVKIKISSLFTKKIVVEEVNVKGLKVYCESSLTSLNLIDILNHVKEKTKSDKKPKKKTKESEQQVVIRHLKIEDSAVDGNIFAVAISLNMEKNDIGEEGGSSWKDFWGDFVNLFKLPGEGFFKKLFSK